jgi:hypothetical protein
MINLHPLARRFGELGLFISAVLLYDTVVIHRTLLKQLGSQFPQIAFVDVNRDWLFPLILLLTAFLLLYGRGDLDRWLNPNSEKYRRRQTVRSGRG